MKCENFIGRIVKDSTGDRLEVVFLDPSVGCTLSCLTSDKTMNRRVGDICINGHLSPNKTTDNYEELFNELVRMIDNWYIDMDIITMLQTNGRCSLNTKRQMAVLGITNMEPCAIS